MILILDLKLRPKGTGNIEVLGATNPGSIQLNCESNSHGIILQSPPQLQVNHTN